MGIAGSGKILLLTFLAGKGPDDPGALQVLAGQGAQRLLPLLDAGVVRQGALYHLIQHQYDQRGGDQEDQRDTGVQHKGHHDGTDGQKGGAGGKTDEHVHAVLHLVHIVGDVSDQAARADGVGLMAGQAEDVAEDLAAQGGAEAKGGHAGKVLAGGGCRNAKYRQQKKKKTLPQHIGPVSAGNAHINDVGHEQRDHELQHGFQQFEQGSEDQLGVVSPEIGAQCFQAIRSFAIK